MPNIDLSILNQRATPAFFADTLANRPAPSFVGRIFISTDTLDLYRDTGTAWLLLSPSSTGTITGSGAAGQVTIFSGASSITGTNNLFWDTSNLRLGINTNTPGAALDLHSTASTLMQLNQTTATNDTRIAFQNSGTALWRIGNFYNAGANDWGIFDVVGAAQPFTIKKTTGQTFIGAETTSSGRLVVNNTTGDNHIVVIGATAPSIRINNAGSGATRQIGIGLATAVNNFIQGTTGGEMAIFNSNTTASPILFGIYDAGLGNTQEAARISASRNLLVGQTADTGQTLQVTGSASITGITQFSNTGAFVGFPGVTINQGSGTGIALSITKAGNNEGLYINKTSGTGNAATIIGNVGVTGSVTATGLIVNTTSQFTAGGTAVNSIYASGPSTFGISNSDAIYLRRYDVGQYQFQTVSGGASGGNLSLQSYGGFVGIGTTSPNTPLVVYGGHVSGQSILKVQSGSSYASGGLSSIGFNDSNDTRRGLIYHNNDGLQFETSSSPIFFNPGGNEKARFFTTGNLLLGTSGVDNGNKLQVNGNANFQNPNSNSGNGGFTFFTLRIQAGITTNFYQVPSANWGGITEITWVSSADSNRSGAALLRWAYDIPSTTTGVVYTAYSNNQNAVPTFSFGAGYLRIDIAGGSADYYVQFRIQGSQAV